MNKQKARRLRLQKAGKCIDCRRPRDGKSKVRCRRCLALQSDRQHIVDNK